MGVAAIIPCKDEADRIAATVRRCAVIDGVDLVVVVDDGSTDETASKFHDAGAHVVRHAENSGKAAASTSGIGRPRAAGGVGSAMAWHHLRRR